MFHSVLKHLGLSLFACLLLQNSFSQDNSLKTILSKDSVYKQSVSLAIEKKYQSDMEAVSGDNKKYIKEIYKERYEYIKSNLEIDALITDPSAVSYLQGLTQRIISVNPVLQEIHPRVLFYKAWWPNASSMGEGTIFINIGILYKLRNEAQMAFILCHELAHLYLDHGNKRISKYVNTIYSEEFQKELKKISKQQYEKNRQLKELEQKISFSSHRHSREKETEADSMAIEFLKNTIYDVNEAQTALSMLDTIDNDKYNIEPPLTKYFNHPQFPFKQHWVKEEETFFGGVNMRTNLDKKLDDSLKTHPDCEKRIVQIAGLLKKSERPGKVLFADEAIFRKWQKTFDYEVIAFIYDRNNISLALYQSLQSIETYPNDPWLLAMIGNCLNRMYTAQKKHELNRIAELPSPYHEAKYNKFLEFIQHLSLTDIASLAYYFLEQHKEPGKKNEEYVYALIHSKDNFGKPEEKQPWIDYYKTTFTKPVYKF